MQRAPLKKNISLVLFPNYFKKIGIAIILLAVLSVIIAVSLFPEIKEHKLLIKTIFIDLILTGMLCLSMSRDKIEDEMTNHLRFRSMAFSFLWGVGYVIVYPPISYLIDGEIDLTPNRVVGSMLLIQLFMFYWLKRSA